MRAQILQLGSGMDRNLGNTNYHGYRELGQLLGSSSECLTLPEEYYSADQVHCLVGLVCFT